MHRGNAYIDAASIRGELARHRVSRERFSRACGLSKEYICRILSESIHPGELACIKIKRGLASLGLASETEVVDE